VVDVKTGKGRATIGVGVGIGIEKMADQWYQGKICNHPEKTIIIPDDR
jgi:hypothetical protein